MYCKLLLFLIISPFIIGTSPAQLIPNGSKYIYKFENTVELLDLRQTPYNSGYRIESTLAISSIWNYNEYQLLHFELDTPKILTKPFDNRKGNKFSNRKSPILSEINHLSSFILLEKNKIVKFLTKKNTSNLYLLNLQRGLTSLFQYQTKDENIQEYDSSGRCNVLYQSKSSKIYHKIKTDCRNWDLRVNIRTEKPLGVGIKSYQETIYELNDNNALNQMESFETHSRFVKSKPDAGSKIQSRINLKLLSSEDNKIKQNEAKDIKELIENLVTIDFKEFDIEAEIDGSVSHLNRDLKKQIKLYLPDEMSNYNLGKLNTAMILGKLLPIARITTTEEFLKILKSPSTQEAQYQLIDLLGATQTIESHKAFCQTIQFHNEDDIDIIERYLQALSISSRPNLEIFKDLYERLHDTKMENENLRNTLIQTLSAILSKYSKFTPHGFSDDIIMKYKNYILDILKDCPDTTCKLVYIQGLQNLQDPSTIDLLIGIALKEQVTISVAAMKALKKFEINLFNDKNRIDFEKIFYQTIKKFDSSARILALDILLEMKPTKDQLTKLLIYLNSNDKAYEVKTYLLQKIRMISEKCYRFAGLLNEILKNNPNINNYDIIAQKGLTTALHRTLSTVPALNETLLSVQEIYNGVLKQGTVDLILNVDNEEFSTFKLGLYTSGLHSFVSQDTTVTDDDDDLDEEPTTAGMEITIQGVQYRPLIFFNGQSELMGHVWSGTASEPTTAYQATTIQQDHEDYILLQNGATVHLSVIGAKSIDINGQIQFSLWNRNAHTEIIQNSGIAILGSMKYGTSFLKMENNFSIGSEPTLNTVVDVDFYSDILLCVQLNKPDSNLWHKIEKSFEIIETKFKNKNSINIKYKIPGNTLALNNKNNKMCNKIAG